ncbi:MAG: DUF72 domain-containing protein [Bacillota bacterium]
MGRLFLGTSGFSYKEWIGSFYPPKMRGEDMLPFYAARFNSVEINSTFHRFPASDLLGRWRDETPTGFVFAFKARGSITHKLRLRGAEEETSDFLDRVGFIGDRLGPVLFGLPPNLKRDGRLWDFLDLLPPVGRRAVFEFRNASWYVPETFEELAAAGVGFCLADGTGMPVDERTMEAATHVAERAGFAYLRLRGTDYTDADLVRWADFAGRLLDLGDAHVYFKHEEEAKGPRYAAAFGQLLGWAKSPVAKV